QDMFGLFMQLQKQQQTMQQQLVDMLTFQQKQEARKQRASQEELEADKRQRDATLESWRTEPRDHVWIEPDLAEQQFAAAHKSGEMPPRVFWVNGLEFPIKVGEVVEVPRSIAAMVRHTQKARGLHKPPPGVAQIDD